ncbi:orotidine-5'-phosphate decarboxylase [Actinomyces mediterranea]|uniref:orotidine-5'-phosphate decarboxylase n=1 Tax=Actinomyces mediterranea TaxID=1871028 RepID=UPI000970F294|nr:orotidine-5'-phosphate decarboxylase [Actinomyces mediterranea]
MTTRGFGDRLAASMDDHGAICVGIDPHPGLLDAWGLHDSVDGLRSFSLTVVDALGGRVGAFKPQVAFFERFGSAGIAILEEVIVACREAGSLCIVDAKRGDIGSTMTGYAQAFLADDSPLAGDAVTLSPYLGVGSLRPALDMAAATGRGVFVLALTSNPEGAEVQHSRDAGGESVAAGVVRSLGAFNASCPFDRLGPAGVVIGATVGGAVRDLGVDVGSLHGPILAPGVGAQGAGPADIATVFAGARSSVLASSSRAILAAGPEKKGLLMAYDEAVKGLID